MPTSCKFVNKTGATLSPSPASDYFIAMPSLFTIQFDQLVDRLVSDHPIGDVTVDIRIIEPGGQLGVLAVLLLEGGNLPIKLLAANLYAQLL